MSNLREERRLRTVTADRDLVLEILRGIHNCELISLPRLTGLPDDAYLEDVHYDHARDAWLLLLSSKSFEPVPPYNIIPNLNEFAFTREVWVRKDLLETHSVN